MATPSLFNTTMPGALTLDTSQASPISQAPHHGPPPIQSQTEAHPQEQKRSESPIPAPPYSPITPTREYAYTHHSQPDQSQNTFPQPPPIPLDFEDNSDVIALKSAIAILQVQARNAGQDIKTLRNIKARALADPEGFLKARERGEVRVKEGVWGPSYDSEESDGEDGEEGKEVKIEEDVTMNGTGESKKEGEEWLLPRMQNVVRCPPVNWGQYAIVGESLEKIHKDQLERPVEGAPQRVAPDGSLIYGGEGERREHVGVYAPYDPLRDKVDPKKKSAKR